MFFSAEMTMLLLNFLQQPFVVCFPSFELSFTAHNTAWGFINSCILRRDNYALQCFSRTVGKEMLL